MSKQTIQVQAVLYQNEAESLLASVQQLAAAIRYDKDHECLLGSVRLVWGDASPNPLFSEAEIEKIAEPFADLLTIRYVYFNENTGYGKGHNRMAKDAESDFLLIENPDILICPDFFSVMLHPFSDTSVGLTEARQTPIEHPKQFDPKTLEVKWASGACFLIRTDLFQSLEGFDDRSFFMYSEDVDLSLRVRMAGKKLIYRPMAPVYHAKKLDEKGILAHTQAELRHSAEAQMVIAYKWKQDALLRRLINAFSGGDDLQREAVQSFHRRLAANELFRIQGDTTLYRDSDFEPRFNL